MTYICSRFPTRWLTFCVSFWFMFSILIVNKKLQRNLSVHRVTTQAWEFFTFLEACSLGRELVKTSSKGYPVPVSYIFLFGLLCCNGTVSLGFTTRVKMIIWVVLPFNPSCQCCSSQLNSCNSESVLPDCFCQYEHISMHKRDWFCTLKYKLSLKELVQFGRPGNNWHSKQQIDF